MLLFYIFFKFVQQQHQKTFFNEKYQLFIQRGIEMNHYFKGIIAVPVPTQTIFYIIFATSTKGLLKQKVSKNAIFEQMKKKENTA